ncbi:MAG: dihydroneopterin aldolase [Chitinophagales bacterium]|nr:dihydroneopterin aldolase [Chitinophagaceae bacterium]MCB9063859.1 dihydroneopterin aldolase [Chitinophagales bacterium]
MLTVSLHGIKIHAPIGVYKEEKILDNEFEVDVDVSVPATNPKEFPFIDYTLINKTVSEVFEERHELLEQLIKEIYNKLKAQFPESNKVKIVIRKKNPPMSGEVGYAQVGYEG